MQCRTYQRSKGTLSANRHSTRWQGSKHHAADVCKRLKCLAVCVGSDIAVSKAWQQLLTGSCLLAQRIAEKERARGCKTDELYLVLVIGRGCASFQIAHLTVLISNYQGPLKLQHQSVHVTNCMISVTIGQALSNTLKPVHL